jgi:DNA-binding CsgD family transcriptional regulator
VFVSTTTSASPPPESVLTALFDLTPAEARVALAVISDASRSDMLVRLQINENTLKTHLSRVYKKTQTHNLAELVKLISVISKPSRG